MKGDFVSNQDYKSVFVSDELCSLVIDHDNRLVLLDSDDNFLSVLVQDFDDTEWDINAIIDDLGTTENSIISFVLEYCGSDVVTVSSCSLSETTRFGWKRKQREMQALYGEEFVNRIGNSFVVMKE